MTCFYTIKYCHIPLFRASSLNFLEMHFKLQLKLDNVGYKKQ